MKSKIFKKFMGSFLALAMVISLSPALTLSANAADPTATEPTGDGLVGSPYQIATLAELYWIADQVNNHSATFAGKFFEQTADIDASSTSTWFGGAGWTPILGDLNTIFFSGTYDGKGHAISGLYINRPSTDYVGLFGIASGATIKNIGLTGVSIIARDYTGGLIGGLYGGSTVDQCSVTGAVSGYNEVGGLIGENDGFDGANSVSNCHASCTISVGNVQGGGLIGKSDFGTVSNCYATGSVTGVSAGYLAGLIGQNNSSTINNCYATGASSGTNQIAGLIGCNYGTVINCYATGSSTSSGDTAGGLIGYNTGTVSYCYAIGAVSCTATNKGGLVGANSASGNINSNCFWNTSVFAAGCGQNSGTFSAVEKTTADMQTTSSYTGVGWDFAGESANGTYDYWNRDDATNNKYPYLTLLNATVITTPAVTTDNVTVFTATSATLGGEVSADGGATVTERGVVYAQNKAAPDLTDTKAVTGNALGSFSGSVSGLTPNTIYSVRAYATNSVGTAYGATANFTTLAVAPTAVTSAAASVSSTGATLNGTVNANNATSIVTFDYGTTTSYGSSATATQSPVTGTSATSVSYSLTGLTPNTTYHYRVKAVNTAGTTNGSDLTFTTSAIAPTATTDSVSATSATGATLNGTVNANNASSVVTFEYGTTASYGSYVAADQSPVAGTSATSVSYSLTGLTPNATYHYRVKAVNTAGTTNGADLTFTTSAAAPTVTGISPSSGSTTGGTTVTITGTNFSGATAVTFGATPATGFTVNSAISVTATAPAGSGTVDVKVTTSGGTSATSAANQFAYVAAPTVTAISPTSGSAAGGTAVIITGTNFTDASAVKFGSTAATGFIVNSATQITATTPAGSGTVDITVTTAGGTSATSSADQYTYVAAPTISSITPTGGPKTGGTSVTITGTNLSGATSVTIGGAAATGIMAVNASTITATTPAGTAGTKDVVVTTPGGTATGTGQFTYAAVPTTVTISSTITGQTKISPIPVTITFSDSVTSFVESDITVTNGTIVDSSFSGGGTTYTVNITPTAQGAVKVDVASGVALDTDGNGNTAATQLSIVYDTVPPAVGGVTNNAAYKTYIVAAFGEGTAKLNAADYFSGTTITAEGSYVLVVTDAAGNSNTVNFRIDNTVPTVTISADTITDPTNKSLVLLTIEFSESVSDFTILDISVNKQYSIIASSGFGTTNTTYIAKLVPLEQGAFTVNIATGVATDAAGNGNTASNSISFTFDSIAPANPTADIGAGTYNAAKAVTLTPAVDAESTYYTLDGSQPDKTKTEYTSGTISINGADGAIVVLKAVSYDAAGNVSGVLSNSYTFDKTAPANPTADIGAGTYNAAKAVTLTPAVDAESTYYTLDGTTPDKTKTEYTSGTISVDGANGVTVVLKAVSYDAAGNVSGVLSNNYTFDKTAPAVSGTIGVSDLTSSSTKLAWTAASDTITLQANLQYKVVYSKSDITTVDAADALSVTWTPNITAATVTGLTASTEYYFYVLVKDEAGNKALYSSVTGKTTNASSGGTLGTPSTPTNNAVVEVNGQPQDAGTSNTQTSGGQSVTTITVDDTKLDKILESSGEKPTVTLPSTGSDVTVGELSGQTVKNMETKEATLEIRTETVTYTLPATQINIEMVSEQFGSQVALKDVKVSVSIAEPSADMVKIIEDTANKNSYLLVVKPVEFTITCTSGDKTIDVSKFNGYVERTIAIPDGVDPSKITTGIVLNADGTFSHVPTSIVIIDGKYYAKINSLTNSTYSVVYNPVIFTDVAGHWAKDEVNDMGSRMVVTGIGNGIYEPERSITRAEFAAIVVRAMGLKKGTTESAFGDVTLTDWFNGYVDTATTYALITGYDGASFGPNDTITREQAMAIIARAMKLAGLSASLTDGEVKTILAAYDDASALSSYARESTAACLKTGIVNGTTASAISPKDYVTRAEVAVMLQRLLENSGLI